MMWFFSAGKITAADRDVGKHAKIYYYIISGNENGNFNLDRTTGSIYTNTSFDREETDEYNLRIKATNYPQYYPSEVSRDRALTTGQKYSTIFIMLCVLYLWSSDCTQ
jgi:hypothetical protein